MTYRPLPTCDVVAERFALGEPLAEHAEHAATCPACSKLTPTADALAVTRHAVDPGMGFAARMTVATQKRMAERRRTRLIGGIAGTALVGALAFVVMTGGAGALPDRPQPALAPHEPNPTAEPSSDVAAIRALVRFSDTEANTHLSARWGHIERPLKPYRALLKGQK